MKIIWERSLVRGCARIGVVPLVCVAYLAFDLTAQAFLILRGTRDAKHTYVVEIKIGKATFCSGTVIAPKTILTAAHCISGHKTDTFSYVISTDAGDAITGSINEAAYPGFSWKDAPRNCALCYDSTTFVHDIGLLFTEQAIPESTSKGNLPKRRLDWAAIIRSQGKGLVFSGYGLTDPLNAASGKTRNFGTWPVNNADDWRFYYQQESSSAPIQSTCNGDSGGPTIYTEGETDLIVGVTSTGNSSVCTLGYSTRVDAYLDWINGGYMNDKNAVGTPPPTLNAPASKSSG